MASTVLVSESGCWDNSGFSYRKATATRYVTVLAVQQLRIQEQLKNIFQVSGKCHTSMETPMCLSNRVFETIKQQDS